MFWKYNSNVFYKNKTRFDSYFKVLNNFCCILSYFEFEQFSADFLSKFFQVFFVWFWQIFDGFISNKSIRNYYTLWFLLMQEFCLLSFASFFIGQSSNVLTKQFKQFSHTLEKIFWWIKTHVYLRCRPSSGLQKQIFYVA